MSGEPGSWLARRAIPGSSGGGEATRLQGLVLLAALLVVGLVIALWPRPTDGPDHPYDHDDLGAVSQATSSVTAGEVGQVVSGLERGGYRCVQPRRNAETVQVRCEARTYATLVDLIATTSGDVAYAHLDLSRADDAEATSSVTSPEEAMWSVLDASLLRLWPQDREAVQDLLDQARPFDFMPFGSSGQPRGPDYVTYDTRTSHASWSLWARSVGTPLTLTVRTDHLEDRTWPYASGHYATTLDATRTGLLAQGFSCGEQNCYRDDGTAGKLDASFDVHDGQVVATSVGIRTGQQGGGPVPDLAGRWLAQNLPFLTPGVRQAVARRIQTSRVESQDWHGVVAGVPLDITVSDIATSTPDGDRAYSVGATIGTPLVDPFEP